LLAVVAVISDSNDEFDEDGTPHVSPVKVGHFNI
jgi:hypothetical protein